MCNYKFIGSIACTPVSKAVSLIIRLLCSEVNHEWPIEQPTPISALQMKFYVFLTRLVAFFPSWRESATGLTTAFRVRLDSGNEPLPAVGGKCVHC